jgi:hypothetical protein
MYFRTSLIIIGLIITGGSGYYIGQSPIPQLQTQLSTFEVKNNYLQSQVTSLETENSKLVTEIKEVTENLTRLSKELNVHLEKLEEIHSLYVETLTKYDTLWKKYYELLKCTHMNLTEYIRNGDFDDPIILDPDFYLPYWYELGSGGSIGFSSNSGRTGRAIGLHPGKIIQKLSLPKTEAILTFWILPEPNNQYSIINAYFDNKIIYTNTFTGTVEDYNWEKVTIILNFDEGVHYLAFEVPTSITVRIDDVSLCACVCRAPVQ